MSIFAGLRKRLFPLADFHATQITIHDTEGPMVVISLRGDGNVVCRASLPEAAQAFWRAVAEIHPIRPSASPSARRRP